MPQYYFDVVDAGQRTPDVSGVELVDDQEARDQALGLLPWLARDLRLDRDDHDLVVSARNSRGEIVYEAVLILQGRWHPGQGR